MHRVFFSFLLVFISGLVVVHSFLKCNKCEFLVQGACCIAKPPSCCPNKPGGCPSVIFGTQGGSIPSIPSPAINAIPCSGDQNCPGRQKCCPIRQNSTNVIFYICSEAITEDSIEGGCPAD